MPVPKNTKRMVLAGAVTAITIAGTLYGAGLKTNQEVAQVRTPDTQPKDWLKQTTRLNWLRFCIDCPENPRNNTRRTDCRSPTNTPEPDVEEGAC